MKVEDDPEQIADNRHGVLDCMMRAWQPSFLQSAVFSLNSGGLNNKLRVCTKKSKTHLLEPPVFNPINQQAVLSEGVLFYEETR